MSLKKIAEELGLSTTTVSRALNGYPEVAESTRQTVRAAAARRNYRPDPRARGLALGRSGAVGVVFPFAPGDVADAHFLAVVDAMSEHVALAGLDLLMISADARDELPAYQRAVAARRVDAFVVPRIRVRDDRLTLLRDAGVPFVACGRCADLPDEHAWFDVDDRAGARLATARLIAFGHRAIGYIGAPADHHFATLRHQGFVAARAQAGLVPDTALVVRDAVGRRAGYRALQTLLARPTPPTAVLVDNLLAGTGAVQAALDADLVLGRDLSVIVCDGLGADSVIRQRVTTIARPDPLRVGTALASMVLARLHGVPPAALQHLEQPVLVPGDSDGPPCAVAPRAA